MTVFLPDESNLPGKDGSAVLVSLPRLGFLCGQGTSGRDVIRPDQGEPVNHCGAEERTKGADSRGDLSP